MKIISSYLKNADNFFECGVKHGTFTEYEWHIEDLKKELLF